ncbi:hypothetical protein P148_SR1C00001G0620 [candidate division SR1 bacterium RAAC1_SR1_1]|nr:hypothetical protein P148_SR1C00001G0620 [candidate division SR1 bacterium RAAC1_SR1_1]
MTVTVKIENSEGKELGSFIADDRKSLSQMAQDNNIDIPVSCCMGACYVCACQIKKGAEHVKIDKLMPPAILPAQDENKNFKEIFTCVGGIQTEKIKSKENFEVILQKNI